MSEKTKPEKRIYEYICPECGGQKYSSKNLGLHTTMQCNTNMCWNHLTNEGINRQFVRLWANGGLRNHG